MSDTTAHLALPFVMAAQAQKHVTHNAARLEANTSKSISREEPVIDALIDKGLLDRINLLPDYETRASSRAGRKLPMLGGW